MAMRTWLIVLALAGCKQQKEASPTAVGSAGSVAAEARADAGGSLAVVSDAALATAVATADSNSGPAPVDTDKLLDIEAIGPLVFGMKQAAVLKVLGPPKQKSAPVEEGATGEFASTWTYTGGSLDMVAETRTGPAKVRLITVSAPTDYATKRGIKVGSTLAEVVAAYPRSDEGGDDPTQFLVGSPYGGLLFVIKDGKVHEMVLGPMAF